MRSRSLNQVASWRTTRTTPAYLYHHAVPLDGKSSSTVSASSLIMSCQHKTGNTPDVEMSQIGVS